LDDRQLEELRELLHAHIDAFAVNGKIGFSELEEHKIELLDPKPFIEKARRHPPLHVQEAKKQVETMLEEGIVEPSVSPWCSEYVLVRKKTNEWRLCIDFRKLNSVTKRDSFPLPNAEECLEHLAGNRYFSSLDFASVYWQLPVARESRELTAFRVDGQVYQFRRMPFGLTNAPATFQRLVTALFAGMRGLRLQFFLDDICVASETWEDHLELLATVFKKS